MKFYPRIGLTTIPHIRNQFDGDWHICASTYENAVLSAGAVPVPIPALVPEDRLDSYLDQADGMIFIGGPDIPASWYGMQPDEREQPLADYAVRNHFALVRKAFARKIPVLGICLGMQELNVFNGGGLIPDLGDLTPYHRQPGRDQFHSGVVEPGSRLAEIFGAGELRLNSRHHQAVDPARPAPGARITVRCGEVAEAIEFDGDVFRVGVQWHPERIPDENHRRKLFSALVSSCASGR